jgi:zinc transport system substrate-binding protein
MQKGSLMRRLFFVMSIAILFLLSGLVSCGEKSRTHTAGNGLQVVATLFPLYDFARNIGGEKASVTLLLPPGVEPHSFEPRPKDILRINHADIFVYTGNFMEPWAASIVKGTDRRKLTVVDSSKDIALRHETSEDRGHNHAKGDSVDPHIWLDFGNAEKMVDNIVHGFIERDPANSELYRRNAAAYKAKLKNLDEQFRQGLANCKSRLFVHGGHYAFNYLAQRYGLTYVSAYGFSPDAEPSPRRLAEIVQKIRKSDIRYIFFEELIQPRIAQTISGETGAKLLPLNGGHNVTRIELKEGVTFISLLEQDLQNLRTGLQCR